MIRNISNGISARTLSTTTVNWLAVCPWKSPSLTNRIKMERNARLHTPLLVRISFCCSHSEPRLLPWCRTMAPAGSARARRNSQRSDPIIVICTFWWRKVTLHSNAIRAQELTLAAWNKPNAPFVDEKSIVKLVRILCTEAGHPFIFIAKMP